MAICPKCGSKDVSIQLIETGAKTKKYGNGLGGHIHNATRATLAVGTLGASNLFIKKKKGGEKTKIKTERVCICQNCGYTFSNPNSVVEQLISNGNEAMVGGGDIADGDRFSPENPTVRKAVEISLRNGKFSTATLQTWLGKGHDYVEALGAWLAERGIIEPYNGTSKPRKVLISSMADFDRITGNTTRISVNAYDDSQSTNTSNSKGVTSEQSQQAKPQQTPAFEKGEKIPFSKKTAVIVLATILFPPLGIILIARKKPSHNGLYMTLATVWAVIWVCALVFAPEQEQILQDTPVISETEATCETAFYCDYLLKFGDEDVLKTLKNMGIDMVLYSNYSLNEDNEATIMVKSDVADSDKLTLQYRDGRVAKIYNTKFHHLIYYSVNPEDKTYDYPSEQAIANFQKMEEIENQRQQEYDNNHILESDYSQIAQHIKDNMISPLLKAPASAKFQGSWLIPFDGWNIVNNGDIAVFSSYVDSQNSFGAMIRSTFSVTCCKRDGTIKFSRLVFDGRVLSEDNSKCQ